MAKTVQTNLLRLVRVYDPYTKDNQEIQGSGSSSVITGAVNNGVNLVRITSANHGLQTGNKATVLSVGGTTEANNTVANPAWTITRITANSFDLQGSVFTNAYTTGGTVVGAMVGTVDGQVDTGARHLDIYNQARLILIRAALDIGGEELVTAILSGVVVTDASVTWSGSNPATAPKPAGFIRTVSWLGTAGKSIVVMDKTLESVAVDGRNPDFVSTTTFAPVFETATGWIQYGAASNLSGAQKLTYVGISDYALFTDVTGNAVNEAFNDEYQSLLLELAEMIATENSRLQISAYANSVLAGNIQKRDA